MRASDGVMHADRDVTVKVTDADEGGKVELSPPDAQIGVELTATIADSDGGVRQLARSQTSSGHGTGWSQRPRLERRTKLLTADNVIEGETSTVHADR